MSRPRTRSGRLPPNLSADSTPQGIISYRYRNPVTGARTRLGTNRDAAIKAAIALNARFAKDILGHEASALVNKVINPQETIGAFITVFSEQILTEKRNKSGKALAEKTLREYRIMLRSIQREIGHYSWDNISLADVARFLDGLPPRASNSHRFILVQLWRYAIAKGKVVPPNNIPEMTIPRNHVIERTPLTLGQFRKIRELADPWFRNALNLALQSLQRREDLVTMRFEHIQSMDGVRRLQVRQQKVEHRSTSGHILIPLGPELEALLAQCRDAVLSPFLIHRNPTRKRREYLERKEHWTAVAPEMLTREFARLRDQLPEFQAMPAQFRPTFHEIRALGADLYRAAGWSDEAIQKLLGHSTGKMTKHYLDKHQELWVITDLAGLRA